MRARAQKFKAYDGVNNIFNLAYEVLQWKVHRAIIKAKMEPYLGFLHSVQVGKPSLICDLQELYRYVVDDFVIQFCQGLKKRNFTVKSARAESVKKIARARGIADSMRNPSTRGKGSYALYLLIVLILGYFLFLILIPPPVASFSSDVSNENAPFIVQFSDTSQGTVASWQWDFGDGSSSTDQNPSHEYTEARSYAVRLTVSGIRGSDEITVQDAIIFPPDASFSSDVSDGSAPFMVQFSDTSQGTVNSWLWDFGDGSSSTDQNPSHEYTEARSYALRLTASGPKGSDEITIQDAINVTPGPLAEVLVTPTEITLEVQDTAQMVAEVFDQFGNEISNVIFTWSALGQGGSIDETDLFTAGTEAGTFEGFVKVIATQDAENREAFVDVTIEPGPLSEVVVEPLEITLDIGATQHFTFKAFDEFGNEVSDVPASWSIAPDIGRIDSNGVLTARSKAGSFPDAVQVEVIKGTERVSAMADVSIRPDPLTRIKVQPSDVFMEGGGTQQFSAAGFDRYGNEIPGLAFLWEVTGENITQGGLFTARVGALGGHFEVRASATFKDSQAVGLAAVGIPPNFPDFSSVAWLNLLGDAAQFGDVLRLTPSKKLQVGGAWFTDKQLVQGGFETTFQFQITFPGRVDGADGFAFVIQGWSDSILGGWASENGYEGIPNSLAIEFDTWFSPEKFDPSNNHVSVHTRGTAANSADHSASIGSATPRIDMSDGTVHTVKIVYEPGILIIYLDDLVNPLLEVSLDIESTLALDNGKAWVGFTAATGGVTENHDILSWSFSPRAP